MSNIFCNFARFFSAKIHNNDKKKDTYSDTIYSACVGVLEYAYVCAISARLELSKPDYSD